MKPLAILSLALTIGSTCTPAQAPLSPELREGRTVYIDNQTGQQDIADRAFEEIKKGKRFKVVADRSEADLVFTFTFLQEGSREVTELKARTTDHGTSTSTRATAETTNVRDGSTRLTISKGERQIYVDTKAWSSGLFRRAATTNLVRDLH